MNKRLLIIGIVALMGGLLALVLLQTNAQNPGEEPTEKPPILSACSGSTLLFPQETHDLMIDIIPEEDSVDVWRESYHDTVKSIVDGHFTQKEVACTEEERRPASQELKDLAGKLAPWTDEENMKALSQDDMGSVLLEYLRVYECTLREHNQFLSTRTANFVTAKGLFKIGKLASEFLDQQNKINEELRIARPILHRSLTVLGGIDRLRPIDSEFECLQRSSLDIRNILGLTAEVSACLPRIFDAKSALRDPYEQPPAP